MERDDTCDESRRTAGLRCPFVVLHSAMHINAIAAAGLSDVDLLRRTSELAGRERGATVELIAHLAELDSRKLYREQGYGSLFSYCTEALRLSEHATFNRIEAARASRAFPVILDLLAEGNVNLCTVRLLAPHLTAENYERVLAEASGRSKREVEVIVAGLAPQPDAPASVRKLPPPAAARGPNAVSLVPAPVATPHGIVAAPAADAPPPAHRPIVAPLASDRFRVQFTVGRETHEKLRQLQDLLRREIPGGDPGAIFDRALTVLLEVVARNKLAAVAHPRLSRGGQPRSRHVPADVKRKVWIRDHGRCAFISPSGRRCRERTFLEFHHLYPYALGGATTVDNVALRCRAHNAHEAELVFGRRDPLVVREQGAPYSIWSGTRAARHNELCPTRPGASW